MKIWIKKLKEASKLEAEADRLLQDALKIVLNEKGIELEGFYVCRASGNETVVHYWNDEGCKKGLSDLDLCVMESMTKEEIYDYFGIYNN